MIQPRLCSLFLGRYGNQKSGHFQEFVVGLGDCIINQVETRRGRERLGSGRMDRSFSNPRIRAGRGRGKTFGSDGA